MEGQKEIRYIKCRFCDWKILPFRTIKGGRKRSNYDMLEHHCMIYHEDELHKIIEWAKPISYLMKGGD